MYKLGKMWINHGFPHTYPHQMSIISLYTLQKKDYIKTVFCHIYAWQKLSTYVDKCVDKCGQHGLYSV